MDRSAEGTERTRFAALARSAIASVVLAASVAGCRGHDSRPARAHDAATPNVRRFDGGSLDTLWSRSESTDVPFVSPEFTASDDAAVYVADVGRGAVFALDARTGRLIWRVPNVGGDTTVILSPRALTTRRLGGLIAFDAGRRSLVYLSATGRPERRVPLPDVELAQGLCELPDQSVLVAVAGSTRGLLHVGPHGEARGVHRLPWPAASDSSGLLGATALAPTPAGCVVALMLGGGFTVFQDGGFSDPRSYVEPAAFPGVVRTTRTVADGFVVSSHLADRTLAAQDVGAWAGGVVVPFGGRSDDRSHLLDVYDTSGAYQRSFRTATRTTALTMNGTALFLVTTRAGRPTIVAVRWPAGVAAAAPTTSAR